MTHLPKITAAGGRRILADTPWLWGLLAFGTYFYYAQFITTVSWNAIELIIAQHLLDHGVFATSVDYPSAITWRPVLPTMVVTLLRLFTADPIRIYQIYCGGALASLVVTMFLSARTLWGRLPAHLAAFLTFTCPAVTTYLIDHAHSYSHVGGVLFLGPAIYASVVLLQRLEQGSPRPWTLYAAAGVLWGCGYLCRSELLLFCLLLMAVTLWAHRAKRVPLRPLVALALGFLGPFLSYNLYAGRVAQRDGILIRKPIYGFYISQGWVDAPPDSGSDIEADGYVYAQKLYGTPAENDESLLKAIRHNVPAFLKRVQLNTRAFYLKYWDREFFRPWLAGPIVLLLVALATGLIPASDRRPLLFFYGLFFASHFVLIFQIDPRYLTINIPALILLGAGAAHYLFAVVRRLPGIATSRVLTGIALSGALYGSSAQFDRFWRHRTRNETSIAAFQSLGEHFLGRADRARPAPNREPHIRFVFPQKSPLYPEDQFLLAYYSHTAWVNGGAEGPFPRGRFYSYRDCPDDYLFVPAERIDDRALIGSGKIVSQSDNPVLGRYYLVQTRP